MDSATCDATSSMLIPGRPTAMATTMEGTRPMRRVMRRRRKGCLSLCERVDFHGRRDVLTDILHSMNPSETTCPASVAVMLDDCPELRSASAKMMPAAGGNLQPQRSGCIRMEYGRTMADMLYDQIVRIKEPCRDHGACAIYEKHGGGYDENPVLVTENISYRFFIMS